MINFERKEEIQHQLREDLSKLFFDRLQPMLNHFYSKQEAMKISEDMNTHQFYSIQEVIKNLKS